MSKFLYYKGYPLVRKNNELYYGYMSDPYVIMLTILTTKTVDNEEVADTVQLYQMATNPYGVVKNAKCEGGLYEALDVAKVWLEKADK